MHPEDRFQPGDFVIHNGPGNTTGDNTFMHNVSRVVEDTGEFITLEFSMVGEMARFIVCREEYPNFRRCTEIQAALWRS